MYWCPYLDLEVLDLYSLVLPSLGRIEVVIPTILWLASVGFISHCLCPSISFQFCFNPTYYLTCGMEDLSSLKPLLDKLPCSYCVSALSWWQNLPLVSWIVCLNHSGQFSWCLVLCIIPPGLIEMLLVKNESSCTTCIGNVYICTHGNCKL